MSNVHGMIRSAYTFDSDVVSNETAVDIVTGKQPNEPMQYEHQPQAQHN